MVSVFVFNKTVEISDDFAVYSEQCNSVCKTCFGVEHDFGQQQDLQAGEIWSTVVDMHLQFSAICMRH